MIKFEKNMIENLETSLSHDRLTAFLQAFQLRAKHCDCAESANLLIIDINNSGGPTHLLYRVRESFGLPAGARLCAAARVDFGGSDNPLVGALPDELCFSMTEMPQLLGLVELIVAEIDVARCGGGSVRTRLCEVVVVLAIRRAIAIGTVDAGLLAGLAHPKLHKSLIAMHDKPAANWNILDLSAIAGMSRAQFIEIFKKTVGQSPGAYLTSWRLALGRAKLRSGHSVKAAAAMVGFGSAAAFSRAFLRKFGHSPGEIKSHRA
ncbi:helix-turn-helix transcriptional regulator [Buttiauxella agrestis]|uniref:AraC family transcriptional regulator n=1 Tax=Buttiauxella agrestis ATCC 33320 TaxID=1006004 RepID=A0A085GC06_9ENTR|nr:AraC family transcriptional regulator [Buttiauxella agrestis]KFC81251.1 AraC family transcriptional regulator [Buttiauxella agrestis ATCC 33320]